MIEVFRRSFNGPSILPNRGLGSSDRRAVVGVDEMNRLLDERKVPMHYGPEELEEDLQYGRGDQ